MTLFVRKKVEDRMLDKMKKNDWLLFSLISLSLVVLYYTPFLNNFFAYDDFRYIENLFHGPLKVILGYNALRIVSNAVWYPLYLLSGFDPLGYNLFSITLYFANSLLLYAFIRKLFGRRDFAFLAAIIFVANGVATDAVFWRMSVSTLLDGFFYLATLLLYVEYRRKQRRLHQVLSVILFVFAMFSKEDAASLPFIVLLIDALFLDGLQDKRGMFARVIPYASVIVLYLVASNVTFHLLHIPSETAKFFKFRPLYSLLAGYSTFFLNPDGFLKPTDPVIYIAAILIISSFFYVKERKLLILGYLWIFFTFLPPSLSSIGQFQPKYIFNSISRLLYLPSAGSSIVFAVALLDFKERYSARVFLVVCGIFLSVFISTNYSHIQTRGEEWRQDAEPVSRFLYSLKKVMPDFPQNSYVFVNNPPTGRAYVQQSLRAFYRNPTITWIVDPANFRLRDGETGFLIDCIWKYDGGVDFEIYRMK